MYWFQYEIMNEPKLKVENERQKFIWEIRGKYEIEINVRQLFLVCDKIEIFQMKSSKK